ncbi:hypothetical protein LSH36_5g05019 [Paralvinella palmiformis]|uniref:C-type lectin domain-containing protein n=1 Tax=Paralvinella palmiformis TaxID=53620 RepID=A0AAD9KEQ9_9ANNE|nr:hypothetical protein LSH36_5g05019 [Paralvinella palmiformis]
MALCKVVNMSVFQLFILTVSVTLTSFINPCPDQYQGADFSTRSLEQIEKIAVTYYNFSTRITWCDGFAFCKSKGQVMVNIKDKKKLEYLKNASRTIRTSSGAWVGSRRIDNGVRGVTETSLYDTNGIDFSQDDRFSPVIFSNWFNHHPKDEDCMNIKFDDQLSWYSSNCEVSDLKAVLCEEGHRRLEHPDCDSVVVLDNTNYISADGIPADFLLDTDKRIRSKPSGNDCEDARDDTAVIYCQIKKYELTDNTLIVDNIIYNRS